MAAVDFSSSEASSDVICEIRHEKNNFYKTEENNLQELQNILSLYPFHYWF